MIASYLDPRFKALNFVSQAVRDAIKNTITDELEKAEAPMMLVESSTGSVDGEKEDRRNFMEKLLGGNDKSNDTMDLQGELYEYDRIQPAKVSSDPLQWWKIRANTLPRLATLARRYLAVQATSASSERLFSAFGLVYEQRRMTLKSDCASAIVFLHENFSIKNQSPMNQ